MKVGDNGLGLIDQHVQRLGALVEELLFAGQCADVRLIEWNAFDVDARPKTHRPSPADQVLGDVVELAFLGRETDLGVLDL